MLDRLFAVDSAVLLWVQAHLRVPVLDRVVSAYTTLGNAGALFLLLAAVLLCVPKTRRAGVTALVAMAMGFVGTNLILKHLVARPRPFVELAGLTALVTESDPNSFPSGHTTAAFAFAVALWPNVPRRWMAWAGLCAAVLMAFSRLYVGVHYPSDVLAGALMGCLAGCLARRLCGKIQIKQ